MRSAPPLAVLRSEANNTRRHPPTRRAEQDAFVNVVAEQTERMEAVVTALLLAAASELNPNASVANLGVAVAESVSRVASGGKVDVRVLHDDAADSIMVAADHELVVQVIRPLLENAIQHAASTVEVLIGSEAGVGTATVADDGGGLPSHIDPEDLFLPGVRGDSDRRGAGLGLALAARLARSVHGEVTAHRTGSGAQFEIALPLADRD